MRIIEQFIISTKLESVFSIRKLDSIKNVCGIEFKGDFSDFDFFCLTLHEFQGNPPELCDKMEQLNKIIPLLIDKMKGDHECVLQIDGPMYSGELPELYQYFFTTEKNNRYYCPAVMKESKTAGYCYSWISLDFNKEQLMEIPLDESVVILQGLTVEAEGSDLFQTVFKQEWSYLTLEPLIKSSVAFFSTDSDFEFFSVASKIPMEEIVEKWRKAVAELDGLDS